MSEHKPIVIPFENRVVVDVDHTLIETGRFISVEEFKENINSYAFTKSSMEGKTLIAPYYDGYKMLEPKEGVIAFVKSLKARGYHVTVHSNNGYLWAYAIVVALELEPYVDLVCTKSSKCIDDSENFQHIVGSLIHPKELI